MQFVDLKAQYARIRESADARIARVLEHGQYILGPEVAELEARLAAFAGVRHCVAVSSGSDALLMAMLALDIGPGDSVLMPAFSFFATAEMAVVAGVRPEFTDILPATFNMDADDCAGRLHEGVRAIVAVDMYGQCADYERLAGLAEAAGVPLLVDAAQSFGALRHGRRAGSVGRIACTSFFPSKPLGCYGDGGACFTDDDAIAARLRRLRVHGDASRYEHVEIGINGRMDTLQAAVLLAKMEVFEDELERREAVAAAYDRELDGLGLAQLAPARQAGCRSAWAQYTIRVPRRDAFIAAMQARGVPTAVHYPLSLPRQPALVARGFGQEAFPATDAVAASVVSLPMHPYLEASDIQRVAVAVAEALATADENSEMEGSSS